jgi:hypothetical protein
MNQHLFSLTAGTVFLLIALAHLLRIILGIPIVVKAFRSLSGPAGLP